MLTALFLMSGLSGGWMARRAVIALYVLVLGGVIVWAALWLLGIAG